MSASTDAPSSRRARPRAAAPIDPVCGMTVDPHTTPSTAPSYHGHTYYFCSAGCRTQIRRRSAEISRAASATPPRRSPEGTIYTCPMHPRDPPGRARLLPDLRHGARARDRHRRDRPQSRARRHDAPVLDRARAARCRCSRWRWAAISPALHMLARQQTCRTGSSSRFATPVVLWAGWPFFVRGWQSLRHAQSQHVHADRHGHRRRLRLQRRRDARARPVPGRVPRRTTARSRSISRPPPSSPCWCCSARCWSCARASAPRARSARCSISRPRPRAASRDDGSDEEVALDAVAVGDRLRVRPGEKVPVDGVVLEGRSVARRIDGDRRIDAGDQGARRQGHRRHPQPDRQLRHARRQGRPRHAARADRADGGARRSAARAPIQRLADQVSGWFVPR